MAWTTSARLRARPLPWAWAAAQQKKARLLYASLRRSLWRSPGSLPDALWRPRWQPGFAFALPLAALGALTPLLPSALTASLLLAAGTGLALYSFRARRSPAGSAVPLQRTVGPREEAPAPVPGAPHALAIELPPSPTYALPRPRIPSRPRDRSWADLMARVNHDLRTPLNAVIGFSELMAIELFGPLGDERYQDYVHHIRDSATDLLKSAEDTLALTALVASSGRRGEISACELEPLAADAWAFVCRKAAARAVTFVSCVPAGLEALGEPRALRQVFVNMLSEALARAAHGERITLIAAADGEIVELSVSVSRQRSGSARRNSSLAMCVARTLLELQGSSLQEDHAADEGWRAVTVLDRAAQPDFFSDRLSTRARESVAALAG